MGASFSKATAFSIEALKHEATLCLKKHLKASQKQEDKSQEIGSLEDGNAEEQSNESSLERDIAARKIQAWFRGTFVRLLVKARSPGK